GCNSSLAPTTNSFANVTATGQCGAATLTITVGKDTNSGCVGSRTFTFTAVDGCSNTTVKTVEYTWTAGGQIEVMCPSNVTIVTNMCQMYCTFAPCDWGCACAGCNNNNNNWWGNNWGNCNWGWGNNNNWGWGNWNQNSYNNCWWQNWCSSNTSSQCWPSWTNWWNSCGSASQCSNLWKSVGSSQTNCWAGSWNNNQYGNWWTAWNCGNQGNQWVPCNGNNPSDVLTNCFRTIYTNGAVCVGLPNSGKCFTFTSPNCIQTCLNWGGACAPLTSCATNPATCSSGAFCAQVLALRLNCDFGDSGCSGLAGRCGDLVYNCPSSPCNGKKVRDILGYCNTALGGGSCPSGCSVQYLCGLCSNLNNCFRGCQPSSWCSSNLTSVYIPPVSQTGTATVVGSCTPNPTLTNYDTVVSAGCTGNYVIEREWVAVDACGNSNTCTQLITIGQTNSSSISGVVVLACTGDTNFSNNEGLTGVTVTLKEGSTVIATTTTDTNGNYDFSDVSLGDYTVVVTPPSGLSETYPATTGNSAAVNLTACQNGVANFAYIGTTPGVQFIKSAPCTIPCSGIITYSFSVTNTGNTCETLKVVDPLLGGTIFTQTGVAPGQGFVFTSNYNAKSTACMVTNTAQGIGTAPNGKSVTNTSTVVTCVTTKCVTNSVCCSFNSQNPGGGNLWCNSHLTCTPGKACTVYCQHASVTLTCNDGKTYTFPVPDCQVNFSSSCSSGTCSYNGSSWQTTLPCKGDSQCFLSGCGIPWQSDFANCRSACWTGTFSCSTPGVACNWQWSCANYNCNLSNCGNINVKPCYQTSCGYNNSDCAGTPENCKSSCQAGGCGTGGNNYCGSWSNSGSFTCN
ncbi:MAG TPA: SdrD B-like domain-containing protein, partial [Verrucomicrobiae bacterium]|nr:SdrD B-like domain-containing protein [Verrucomicrobiae bacterium]